MIGALLKIVKNEIKTTNAKARSVPVFKVNPDFFSGSIEAIIAFGFLIKTLLKAYFKPSILRARLQITVGRGLKLGPQN